MLFRHCYFNQYFLNSYFFTDNNLTGTVSLMSMKPLVIHTHYYDYLYIPIAVIFLFQHENGTIVEQKTNDIKPKQFKGHGCLSK